MWASNRRAETTDHEETQGMDFDRRRHENGRPQ